MKYSSGPGGGDDHEALKRKHAALRREKSILIDASRGINPNPRVRTEIKNLHERENNDKPKIKPRNLDILVRTKKLQRSETNENTSRIIKFFMKHGTMLEMILVTPLTLMSLYIIFIENGTIYHTLSL